MKHLLVSYRCYKGKEHLIELFTDSKNHSAIADIINNRRHSHAPVRIHNIIERGEAVMERKGSNTLVYIILTMLVIAFWALIFFAFLR